MTMRIGLIGAGNHGARYLRHAQADVPGLEPVALCRRDRQAGEALAAELGCRYLASPEALVADPAVDGVIVCTPPASHFEFAAAVLAAGKPLLLEKPLTATLAEADRLAALDLASPAPPLLLAQTLRWNPVVRKVKELWPALGPVHLVRMAQRLAPTELAWQWDKIEPGGGSVLWTGVHLFDTVRYLTGREFRTVDSRQRNVLNPTREDYFLARCVLDDDCQANLEVSKYTTSRAGWLEVVGEKGQLLADYQYGGVRLRLGGNDEAIDVPAVVPTLPGVLADWLEALQAGAPMPVGAGDGVRTLEVVEACYLATREERSVSIAELRG